MPLKRSPMPPRKTAMRRKAVSVKKLRVGSKRALRDECDKQTSLAVRYETPYCVLCGERDWQKLTCGHMFKRGVEATRFDYLVGGNCHTLCRSCNYLDNEHHDRYVFWYVETYGSDAFAALRDRAYSGRRFEPDEIQAMIVERKARVRGGMNHVEV